MTVRLLIGDVRDRLREIPDKSVHCVVSSPPYWGLLSYLAADHPEKHLEIGTEPTLEEHLANLVEVYREVRRILRDDGTNWINYGDVYATKANGRSAADTTAIGRDDRKFRDKPFSTVQGDMQPGDLCLIPAQLALAMRASGWCIRARNVWGKKNPMPDSRGNQRPSNAHEEILLFAKSVWHYYDAKSVMLPVTGNTHASVSQDLDKQRGSLRANGGTRTNRPMKAVASKVDRGRRLNFSAIGDANQKLERRLLRNYEPPTSEVWRFNSVGYRGSHFATYPKELPLRCIAAGCPPGGTVLDPFGGVGTTAIAAEMLGCNSIIIELNMDSGRDALVRFAKEIPTAQIVSEVQLKRGKRRKAA